MHYALFKIKIMDSTICTNHNPNPGTFLQFVELIGKLCLRYLFLILPELDTDIAFLTYFKDCDHS